MIQPLKLRLRVNPPSACLDGRWYIEVACSKSELYQYADSGYYATLEFENPLNGTWHPVEVVDEKEKMSGCGHPPPGPPLHI